MLRCLGQSEYGLYSLVASIIAYLTLLDFGFGNAIIRYTAKLRAERKEREQWQMFGLFYDRLHHNWYNSFMLGLSIIL